MKIVIAERISAAGYKLLQELHEWQVVGPEEFAAAPDEHIRDADALIVRSAVQADRKLIEKAGRLRVIGRAGVGVDNVDVELATHKGIVVMNTPGANAVAVAEHTIGLMICLARHICKADQSTRAGGWEKKNLQGRELAGKTLGIVGLGRIGVEVARRAGAMGMHVFAYDPYVASSVAREVNASLVSLDELYAASDYISLHVGLTAQTSEMVNAAAIAKMKRGVRLVNCARGELIDERALLQGLRDGHVAGAALDVFTVEPPRNNPLFELDNVIATPHIGGSTAEAQEAVGSQIAAQVREYLTRDVAQNAVNIPSLTDVQYAQLRPYLELAERMCSLLGQLIPANLEELRIEYSGPITEWRTELVRSSAIKGVLKHSSEDPINLVNASAVAKQRGLHISEVRDETGSAAGLSLLFIRLKSNHTNVSARGTVVHGNSPRVTELNTIEIEAPLEGNLLVISNRDLPGVIGSVGSILGGNRINIARFALGRSVANRMAAGVSDGADRATQRHAMAIVQTDSRVPEHVMQQLRDVPEILSVSAVVLD